MVQVVEQNDIFGRIGKNFGQGIGEGLERSASAERSANIVERASQPQDGQPANMLSMITTLMRDPNMTTEKMQMLAPFIRNQMIQNQDAQGQQSTPTLPMGTQPIQDGGQPRQSTFVERSDRATEGQTTFDASKLFPSQEQLRAEGEQLSRTNPLRFPSVEDGINEAQRQVESNQKRYTIANSEFDSRLMKRLQSQGIADSWSQVPGEVNQRISDRMLRNVFDTNMNPITAAQKAADEGVKFAKNQVKLDSLDGINIFGKPAKGIEKDYAEARKTYEEFGALEEFKDKLISNGHGQFFASAMAFPLSESVKKEIDSLNTFVALPPTRGLDLPAKRKNAKSLKEYESLVSTFPQLLRNDDSLHTIALAISDKGYDSIKFYDAIRDAQNDGKLELTDRQERELIEAQPVKFTLSDILNFNMFSPTSHSKVPRLEMIQRTIFGKR